MFGDYPSSMRSRVGNRLPKFSQVEAALVKGSLDFVGINHYTTFYARNNSTNLIGTLLHDSVADSGTVTLRKFHSRHYQIIISSSKLFIILLFCSVTKLLFSFSLLSAFNGTKAISDRVSHKRLVLFYFFLIQIL